MAATDWKKFLTKFSADLIAVDQIRAKLDSDVIAGRWLGFTPASDEDIAQCQQRLGVTLPPSLVAFLQVSNGWRTTGPFVSQIWSTSEIRWLKEVDPELISLWQGSAGDEPLEPDIEHCLALSPYDDGMCLLNSNRRQKDDEWEAWFFAHWVPGPEKYRTFAGLFRSLCRHVRDELADQKQAKRVDQSLPSLRELFDASRVGGWQGPEKFVDDILRILDAPVRDPQYRWSVTGQLCNIRMTAEQEARFRTFAEIDPDPKVRKAVIEVLELRSEFNR